MQGPTAFVPVSMLFAMGNAGEAPARAALEPEVAELVVRVEEMFARVMAEGPVGGGTFAQMRVAALAATEEMFEAAGGQLRPLERESEHLIPVAGGEVLARAYTPPGDGPFPALVHFHGGAWVMGSPDWPTFKSYARELCERVGCFVLDVDYRLAPEFQFPVGLEDCYASLEWLADHARELNVDPGRIAVGGDSAGGTLAAAVCLMARDRGGPPIVCQLLEIPAPDHAHLEAYPSAEEFATGYGLDTEGLVAGRAAYFADPADASTPYASPMLAEDLSGLPPAYIVTAEFDPLRDSGEAYGKRLREFGVPTVISRQPGHVHGASILLHPRWEGARRWHDVVVEMLTGALAGGSTA